MDCTAAWKTLGGGCTRWEFGWSGPRPGFQDFKGLAGVFLDGKIRRALAAGLAGRIGAAGVFPFFQGFRERERVAGRNDVAVQAGLEDFGKSVRRCGDHGESRREGFQAGVREGIIPSRSNQDIRCCKQGGQIGNRSEEPHLAASIQVRRTATRDEEKDQTWTYYLQVDGPLRELPAGALAAAFGVERREEYVDFPIRLATDTATAREGKSDIDAYFAEIILPVFGGAHRRTLLHQLSVSGSFRQEAYGSGSTSRNPRAGIAWRPVSRLLLRGSYGEGFKVPTLQQRTQPNTVTNSTTVASSTNLDPLRGNTVNPIHPVTRGGKPDLRPETSENTTFGLVAEAPFLKGLSVSFDWFDNVYQDRVGTLLFNQMALLYPERITRGPNLPTDSAGWAGPVTATDLRPINVAFSQTSGYDVSIRYDRHASVGDFQVSLSGTKYLKNTFVPTPGGLPSPSINTDSLPVQVSGNAFYQQGAFGAGVLATYRAANRSNIDRAATPSAIRWDAQLSYDFGKASRSVGSDRTRFQRILGETKLSLTVYNVLDRRPPFDDLFFPDNTVLDARMRRYALSLRRDF